MMNHALNRRRVLSLGGGLLLGSRQAAPQSAKPSEVWITDLSIGQPASARSRQGRKGCWRLIDYEALHPARAIKGSMLVSGPETAPPRISIPLQAKGWHAIYIGLKAYLGIGEPNTVKLKLKSDPCFVLASVETVTGGVRGEDEGLAGDAEAARGRLRHRQLQDCFYKYADLPAQETPT